MRSIRAVTSGISGVAFSLALAISPNVEAAERQSGGDAQRIKHIPAQPLQDALLQLSAQTGMQTSVDAQLIRDLRSPGSQDAPNAEAALTELLSGTGLNYRYTDTGTVLIQRAAEASPASEQAMTVSASAETATGPVHGYRATRSATASKTDTALRDLPQSVQVVPRDVIRDRQSSSLTNALETVSSVRESGTAGNRAETFMVRGFSSPGYAIDGVMLNPASDRPETFLDLANVERIEVLKGPASALYGRGQPGGLINIITRQPSWTPSAEAAITGGSNGFWRGEGSTSGALNADNTLAGRFSGALQTDEGFQDHRARSSRQFGSGALLWEPNSETRISAGLDYTHQKLPFDRGLVTGADNTVSLPARRYLGERWSTVDADKLRLSLGAERLVSDRLTLRGTLRYDDARIRDNGIDYRALGADGHTLSRRYTDRTEDLRGFDAQLEAQLDAATGAVYHTLLGGVQLSRSRLDFTSWRANIAAIDIDNPQYGAAQRQTTLNSDFVENVKMASVFLQDQIEFSPRWKALAGVRYDRVWQEMDQNVGTGDPRIDDGALTSRFGLVYQPTDRLSLYGSYAESFAPQSGQTRARQALDPEKGWQLESGIKMDLLPQKLSLTTALFQIVKTNVKASDPLDSDFAVTTGEQRVRGIEADLTGEILPGWQVVASSAYLDARITRDNDYPRGNRLTGVPFWSGSLWNTYQLQQGRLAGLKFGGGLQAVGARKGDLDNSYSVHGYYRLDASLSYPINKHLDVALLARNLTDQAYIATPVSRMENHPGAPRTLFATLKATF